ncbi:hypothetical protein HYU12_04580 [Candidatus Woesearchaeota archaeon]|nr:hypothetical protein [Candidatus Woesearchaeota archaeon]
MPTVTLTLPDSVKSELKRFSWVNWSEVAREELAREEKLRESFEQFRKIVSKSKFTEKDALELGRKVNESLHERYKKLHKELQ